MSLLNKILPIIFLVLSIIIIAEGYYLFSYQNKFENNQNTIIQPPSPTPQFIAYKKNHALDKDTLNSIFNLAKGVVKSATLNVEVEGKLIEIDDKRGINPPDQFNYKIKIKSSSGDI